MLLLQDFFPQVRAGRVAGEVMEWYMLGLTSFVRFVFPLIPAYPVTAGLGQGVGVVGDAGWAGGDVIPLGCSMPFLRR